MIDVKHYVKYNSFLIKNVKLKTEINKNVYIYIQIQIQTEHRCSLGKLYKKGGNS